MRSSVAGYSASEATNTPLWPYIYLDGRSSMARLDQSVSHSELIISVCPSIYVLQTFDIPPGFFFLGGGGFFDTPTFPYK